MAIENVDEIQKTDYIFDFGAELIAIQNVNVRKRKTKIADKIDEKNKNYSNHTHTFFLGWKSVSEILRSGNCSKKANGIRFYIL